MSDRETVEDNGIEEVIISTTEPTSTDEKNESTKPKLNAKNWCNLIAFILNVLATFGVGLGGWLGTPTNGNLSEKSQTIVTPNGSAFSIWGLIFIAQGIFSVLQMLPKFRADPMLQDGISYWYASACAAQIGWTFSFAYEIIPLSLVFMLSIWISLITILYRQYYTMKKSDGSVTSADNLSEFWVLRFPFAIHAGWITAASALNVNVQVVSMDQPADVQLAVAIVSLAVLHAISVWVLFNIPRPNWTIACVLAWAFGFIYKELGAPNELITSTFAVDTINGVRYAAIAVVCVIATQLVVRLVLLVRPSYNPYKKQVVPIQQEQELIESNNHAEGDIKV